MRVILKETIDSLGIIGSEVSVADGYARNYLIPRGDAMRWTRGSESQIESLRSTKHDREVRDQDTAVELSGQLKVVAVSLPKIANHLRCRYSKKPRTAPHL